MQDFKADKSHWAYQAGAEAARQGKDTERGVMSFGLLCAATSLDARNTKQWLAGFDETKLELANVVRKVPSETSWSIGDRYC